MANVAWHLLRALPDAGIDDKIALRTDAESSLAFAAMVMKRQYDARHKPIHFEVGDWVYIRLGEAFQLPR